MGVDIGGGMILGANASKVEAAVTFEDDGLEMFGSQGNYFEEFYDWYEDVGMETYSLHYDADISSQVVGYAIKDIDPLSADFDDWVSNVKRKAEKFQELTGIKAELIGMQNVW